MAKKVMGCRIFYGDIFLREMENVRCIVNTTKSEMRLRGSDFGEMDKDCVDL